MSSYKVAVSSGQTKAHVLAARPLAMPLVGIAASPRIGVSGPFPKYGLSDFRAECNPQHDGLGRVECMSFFTISVARSLVNRLALLFQAFGALCDREPPTRFAMPHVTSFTIAFANSFHVTIIAILSATSIDFSDDHPSVRHRVREIVHVCISELCMRLLYEFSCACRTLYIEMKRMTCITISPRRPGALCSTY